MAQTLEYFSRDLKLVANNTWSFEMRRNYPEVL